MFLIYPRQMYLLRHNMNIDIHIRICVVPLLIEKLNFVKIILISTYNKSIEKSMFFKNHARKKMLFFNVVF